MKLEDVGLHLPEILLPSRHTDYTKWSVVACDQFTSQPDYWASVERLIGDSPSSLHIILPEAYLHSDRFKDPATQKEYVGKISGKMAQYLADNTLRNIGRCAVYTERTLASGNIRKGLVLAIDLEKYDYSPTSAAMIRPSEHTVPERLPPRVAIRRKASIEAPHTILLFNDKHHEVFLPFEEAKASVDKTDSSTDIEKLYDFDLMLEGGHLNGYRFDAEKHSAVFEQFADALLRTSSNAQPGQLFAVGDGNHSLAAAKLLWEELKAAGAGMSHPARYSLVEIENIHDDSIAFESIHRAVFGIPTEQLVALVQKNAPAPYEFEVCFCEGAHNDAGVDNSDRGYMLIHFKSLGCQGYIRINTSLPGIAIYALQKSLEDALASIHKNDSDVRIDYVHGIDALEALIGSRNDITAFYMPEINKDGFFDTISKAGRFPMKSFSIGQAKEKRYYLECRKIT